MTKFLVRLFVKNSSQTEEPEVRAAYGTMASVTGIVCNILLCVAKLIVGLVSGSVSITADAVNNLSDASSSIVTLVCFRLAQKPEDAGHPYGHARMEYLSGLAVAAMILIIGAQLVKSSVLKIINPEPVTFSGALVLILALSILVKLWMSRMNRTLSRTISSTALAATAADSRNDAISTGVVLAAAIVAHISGLQLDGYMGLVVAVFILYSGVSIARDTISPLLGAKADEALTRTIRQEVLAYDSRVLGVHDLMVHDYGPGQTFASIHVEIDRREDVLEIHEIIDSIERLMMEKHRVHLTIHYDPIVTDDAEVSRMRENVRQALQKTEPRLTFHDFRMVAGQEHSNLIFDVVMPYDLRGQEADIRKKLEDALREPDHQYHLVMTFDYNAEA